MPDSVEYKVRGWVNVDTFTFWCLDCAPTEAHVRALHGLRGDDARLACSPVGAEWASRAEPLCERCGRQL